MVKVLLGSLNDDFGTVEASVGVEELESGLVYTSPDPEELRRIIEYQREWYDRAGVKHELTDDELVRSVPYRLQGHFWAVFVDEEAGLTEDRPPYDPWGDMWKSQ